MNKPKLIAVSGPHGVGKSSVIAALASILGARVVTLPSYCVVPRLPFGAPARQCRDAAVSLGLVRGRLALLADCCAQVEQDRLVGGVVLYSCCAIDTAAHQGESEAVLRLCGNVRPDLVLYLSAPAEILAERLRARDGVAVDVEAIGRLQYAYSRAVHDARQLGWNVIRIGASGTPDEVGAAAMAAIGGGS